MITKIVSGGQTGADRGALDAAIELGIPHGGWCPNGRKAEDGAIPAHYQLREHESSSYLARTEANVVDSDVTVILTMGPLKGGSLKTKEFAQEHRKPHLHIDLDEKMVDQAAGATWRWLGSDDQEPLVLNVAGNRESKSPGIRDVTFFVIRQVLRLCGDR